MSVVASVEPLRAQLQRCVAPAAWHEFAAQLLRFEHDPGHSGHGGHGSIDLGPFLAVFAAISRKLGRTSLGADDRCVLGPHDPVPLVGFSADIAGRALLLLTLARGSERLLEDAVWSAYRDGDTLEKLAVVRTLSLLPQQERFVELSLDAGRTNDARLFRALACDNPFPARHYPELEWNKLFMKAAFVGAPLERILGREQRENLELARMALEYIEEQESAGRSFPPGIWLAIAPFPGPGTVAKLLGYASHAVTEARLGAVHGLIRVRQARTESFLRERLAIEHDAGVRAAISDALAALADERISP